MLLRSLPHDVGVDLWPVEHGHFRNSEVGARATVWIIIEALFDEIRGFTSYRFIVYILFLYMLARSDKR